MLLDTTLLKIMKHKKDYYSLIGAVPQAAVDEKTTELLKDFGKYFNKFPEHDVVQMDVFIPRLRKWRKNMKDERFIVYKKILKQCTEDVPEDTRKGILQELFEVDTAMKLANICNAFDEGDLKQPFHDAVSTLMDQYRSSVGIKALMWDETPVEDLFSKEAEEAGVAWRLDALNNCMRKLRPGDFGIIAARPDQGKTTFISSEVTFMAPQLPEDRNILWFNNEGLASTIRKRVFQSALGLTVSECRDLVERKAGIKKKYVRAVGRIDKIRVMDCHGMNTHQIEAIIEQSNPGVIIFDMLDKVKGFNSESRTDLQLEGLYDWARERAVKFNCIVLATSQISVEGENLQFPALSMLKDSKTGKQGACDFQLMIGSVEGEHLKESRFLSLPKNKLRKDGHPSDPRCEVQFRPMIARYLDIEEGN